MRKDALSGVGFELAFLFLYTYSDAFRNFINYLAMLLFHISPEEVPTYVVPSAFLLLVVSVAIWILDALNISITQTIKDLTSKERKRGILTGEIFGEPENKFLVGGTLCFKAQYHGNLQNGYFTTQMRVKPFSTIDDTGRTFENLVDYNTYDWRTGTGRLNGRGTGWLRKSHKSTWGHKIPFRYPSGKHTLSLIVLDKTSSGQPLAEFPLEFTILSEDLLELRGTTADGEQLPPNRSMFVSKPRKRNWLGALN